MQQLIHKYLSFLDPETVLSGAYPVSYDPVMVLASISVAILTSFAALRMAGRMSSTRMIGIKLAWLSASSLLMGAGVWSMHFIGMLAFSLPCGITYDPLITVLSMLPGMAGSVVALAIIGSGSSSTVLSLLGGVMMAGGIGAMHYSGMAAMRMDAFMRYDPYLFAASILIAVILSTMAIGTKSLYPRGRGVDFSIEEAMRATLLGLAVAGAHYTGMMAARFFPGDELSGAGVALHPMAMGVAISLVMAVMAMIAISAAFFARYIDTFAHLRAEMLTRRRAEEQIVKLSTAVEQSPTSIMITDAEGKIEYVNPRFTDVTGCHPSDAIGNTFGVLRPGNMPEDERLRILDTIKNGGAWRGEMKRTRKDGVSYWGLLSVSPIRNANGEITNFMCVIEDITDRKNAEKFLLKSKEEAEYANKAKTNFLASMSHELRTPLNAIVGFSEIMLMEINGPLGHPLYNQYVEDIKSSGQHLSEILTELLDVAKIESGNVDLDEKYLSISNTADSCMRTVHTRAMEKNIDITRKIPEDLPRLYADEVKLKQICINLLVNAIKYNNPGGSVDLSAVLEDDGSMTIKVADNGIGMEPADIPRALEPFGQIADIMTRSQDGVGLGLHLTKKLAELHGGRLEIESAPGRGTTVYVTFPPERVDSGE